MSNIFVRAPERRSAFAGPVPAVFATVVTAIAGLLAFAPFFATITG
jgi:hypothetical protein